MTVTAAGARTVPLKDVFPDVWGEQYRKHESPIACIACGKPTSKNGNAEGIVISGGGDHIVRPTDNALEIDDAGYMGWWSFGSECIKALPTVWRTVGGG